MAFSGAAFGRGLANAATGAFAGQQEREREAYRRRMDEERIAREEKERGFRELVQRHAMGLADAQNARAQESQDVALSEGGYSRFSPETFGPSVREAAGVAASGGGAMASFLPMAALLTERAMQGTKRGTPVKMRDSVRERDAKTQRQQQIADTAEERAVNAARDERNFEQTRTLQSEADRRQMARDERQFAQQRALLTQRQAAPASATPKPLTGAAAQRAEAMQSVQQALGDYRALLDLQGPGLVSGQDPKRAQLDAQYGALQMALKEAFNLGVLNGPDLKLIEAQLTPPTGIKAMYRGKDAMLAQVDQTLDQMKKRGATIQQVYQGAPSGAPAGEAQSQADAYANETPGQKAYRARAREFGYSDEEISAAITRRGIK